MPDLQADSETHEQFVTLFVRHERAIHAFVRSLLIDPGDAQDVVQEASLTMWRRFDQFQPGTNFRNWAFQIAKFTAFNHAVKARRDRLRFSSELMELLAARGLERADDLETQRRLLDHCVRKLPPAERSMLAECYREGATVKQFAEEAGRTAAAVYKQLHRIRAQLLACVRRTMTLEVGG